MAEQIQGSSTDKLPGIRHVVAVASGKGGVGKSTVSVNLALALQRMGAKVGIVDADILGPSIPTMLGLRGAKPPVAAPDGRAIPLERHGLKCMSMGLLTGDDQPAILRGPMVTKYLQMFIGGVAWGQLDYLILDLPPGTGDIQLSLAQSVPLSGAIIVTTPQDVSLQIARRGLRMFEKVAVPILGIVENMSGFDCPHCGKHTDIFRSGGGDRMARELHVPFLGPVPLDADVVMSGDEGTPIVVSKPESSVSRAYANVGVLLAGQLNATAQSAVPPFNWHWEPDTGTPLWKENAVRQDGSTKVPVGYAKRDPRTLSVLWQDGTRDDYDVRDLRLACQCALCIEEMSGKKLLEPRSVRQDVAPRNVTSVGHYAIAVTWNDGHSSSIYSFEHLRGLGDAGRAQGSQEV